MFEPATILPEQFTLFQRKPLQNEKRLLLAVLEDAVHFFQTYVLATKPSERQLFHDAEDWINSTKRSRRRLIQKPGERGT